MHEYSIVQALIDQCEDHAKAHDASCVAKVMIKVGVMSGVEPDLLHTAFETFKEGTICDKAYLEMQLQEVEILCHACETTALLEPGNYDCPNCHSYEVTITDGKELMLMQLEMQ